jgi:hypothetical protein
LAFRLECGKRGRKQKGRRLFPAGIFALGRKGKKDGPAMKIKRIRAIDYS